MRFIFLQKLLSKFIKPNLILNSYKDINITDLKNQGIKIMIFDLDDTLTSYLNISPTKDLINFFNKLKKNNITSIIASNNIKERVLTFTKQIPTINQVIYSCKKPKTKIILKTLKKYTYKNHEVIFFGDQYLTDILVSKLLKIKSCLITEFIKPEHNFTKPK